MSRARCYAFTLNNYTDEDIAAVDALAGVANYVIRGKEVGEENTPHLQCFVQFNDAKTFTSVKKMLPRAHIEATRGSPYDNYEYCSKDGDFVEHGTRPSKTGAAGGSGNKKRWDDARKAAEEGRFDDIDSEIFMRCHGTIKRIRFDAMLKAVPKDTDVRMEWFWGKAGVGKSRKAREENPGAFLKKASNKWWDGYEGEDVVIIEDFDKRHDYMIHDLKIWGDRYAFPAEVKGGMIKIRPKKLIVTSNWHPTKIWTADEDLEPIMRRFDCTEIV